MWFKTKLTKNIFLKDYGDHNSCSVLNWIFFFLFLSHPQSKDTALLFRIPLFPFPALPGNIFLFVIFPTNSPSYLPILFRVLYKYIISNNPCRSPKFGFTESNICPVPRLRINCRMMEIWQVLFANWMDTMRQGGATNNVDWHVSIRVAT